ncbi:MAG TPA: MarR family transcriptional regulator [Candidatus Saccharimonadia bacterium]
MKLNQGTTYQIGLIQAQAYRRLQNHYHAALEPYGISIPEWSLLGMLRDAGSMTPSELAKILKSKVSHPSALIAKLEKRGLVKRRADGEDKRSTHIALTAAGAKLVPAVENHVRATLRHDLKDLNAAELVLYYRLLAKLAKGFEE